MKKMMIGLALVCASTVFAILPPLAQSSRELQTILSDGRFLELLGSAGLLHSIVKTEEGYLIVTRDHALRVDVEYLRTHRIGPASFQLHFHEPVNINELDD